MDGKRQAVGNGAEKGADRVPALIVAKAAAVPAGVLGKAADKRVFVPFIGPRAVAGFELFDGFDVFQGLDALVEFFELHGCSLLALSRA